jgi:stage III sporulation protein SpoIIIAA
LDLGRQPEARFPSETMVLLDREITTEDLEYVVHRLGVFGDDNRAGIPRTLHRFSCIRNRKGKIIGLTCRVGRAVFGMVRLIEDMVETGQSILLLGKPGVGKTTLLREVARVLASDLKKRVIIVDTSNEIAGDGDIPHPGIGHARRMQVPTPTLQHSVMIEAVENHMPEVIIIDEMGTELEAAAARTIAERGVQLVATAHGNTLENLVMNPTLSDLVGGVQSVTLSDEEARRRRTQKSILERKAPPTFDIVIEIQSRDRLAVHRPVAAVVDALLRGMDPAPEVRWVDENGDIQVEQPQVRQEQMKTSPGPTTPTREGRIRVYPFGVGRSRTDQVVRSHSFPVELVDDLRSADVLLTTKAYYRNRPQTLRLAEERGIPIYVLRKSTMPQIERSLMDLSKVEHPPDPVAAALQEAEDAASRVLDGEHVVELRPQSPYIRRLQHQIAEKYRLPSQSAGKEPHRRVRIFRRSQDGSDEDD